MTNNYYYLAGSKLKCSLSSLPALALAAFVTMHSAILKAQGTAPNGNGGRTAIRADAVFRRRARPHRRVQPLLLGV